MALLSPEQREQFEGYGYLMVPGVVPEPVLAPVRDAIAHTVEYMAEALYRQGIIQDPQRDAPFEKRWAEVWGQVGAEQPLRSWHNEVFDRALYDLMKHPGVVDIAESLIGPEVSVDGAFWIRPKLPREKRTTVLWHQDSNYLGPESAEFRILTVWIPLADTDESNGCMQTIRGSHKWGLRPSVRDEEYKVLRPIEDVETSNQIDTIPMKAGDVLCFTNLTYHRSLMNTSNTVRWSVDIRYFPTGAYSPWFDNYPGFVVRSGSDPGSVGTWEQWQKRHSQGKTVVPVEQAREKFLSPVLTGS